MMNEKSVMPILKAMELHNEFDLDLENEINLDIMLDDYNIHYLTKTLPEEIYGMCKNIGLKRLILISDEIRSSQRKKFTLAHEFGHIILKHSARICKKDDFYLFRTSNRIETEANTFAAELLMPKKGVLELSKKRDLSFDLLIDLSKIYNTSLKSMGIRLVNLSKCDISIISHDKNKVFWSFNSNDFYPSINPCNLSMNPIINQTSSDTRIVGNYIDISQWSNSLPEDTRCYQETYFMNRLNQYLTLLKYE